MIDCLLFCSGHRISLCQHASTPAHWRPSSHTLTEDVRFAPHGCAWEALPTGAEAVVTRRHQTAVVISICRRWPPRRWQDIEAWAPTASSIRWQQQARKGRQCTAGGRVLPRVAEGQGRAGRSDSRGGSSKQEAERHLAEGKGRSMADTCHQWLAAENKQKKSFRKMNINVS